MRTIAVLALLTPTSALAWPAEGDWEDLESGGASYVDPADDMVEFNAPSYLDLVGDSTATAPAGLWYVDTTALYFRIRLDADPSDADYFASEGAWVILIENDGDTSAYEYSIAYASDGAGEGSIKVFSNATKTGDADDPAENILWETDYDSTGLIETAEISIGDSSISLNDDYFIDITIPWTDLETETAFAFSRDVSFQVALATAEEADNAASVDVDLAEAADMDELATAWSDAIGIDLDDDGLIYFEEVDEYGTDPDDADSDDDGLSDGDEVLIYGTDPTLCDSDGDGLSDGLELGVVKPGSDTDTSAGCYRADTDSASTTNPLADDTEGDSRLEWLEDVNGNGRVDAWESDPNIFDVDSDKDGIVDFIEEQCEEADGTASDQDGDGTPDIDESIDGDGFLLDSDGDGLPDFCDPITGGNGGDDTGNGGDDTGNGGDDTGDTNTPDDTGDTNTPDDTGDTNTPDDTGDTNTPDDTGDTNTPDDTGLEECGLPFVCEGRLTGGSCSTVTAAAGYVPALLALLVMFRRREAAEGAE
ncbi:MAG: hypothetical protein ACI8RZ_006199 [Myxococcota bacterium]|jgi:hypothetical protein